MTFEDAPTALRSALWAVACLYLPGRAWSPWLYEHCHGNRGSTSPLIGELALSTVATTWVGFALLEASCWSPSALAVALGVVCLLGLWASKNKPRRRYGREDLCLVALAILTSFWILPPYEARFAAGDATGYLAAGVHAARNGAFEVDDPTVGFLDPDLRRILFPSVAADRGSPPYLRLEGGYVLRSLEDTAVLPAFHHGIVSWVALAAEVFGLEQLEGVFGFFGVLAFVAMFAAARSLQVSRSLSMAAMALAAVQPVLFFYARFPMPELAGAFFLWAGVAIAADCAASGRLAALAGLTLGCAALIRLENAILVSVALALWVCFSPSLENKRTLSLASLVLVAHSLLHAYLWRTHYWDNFLTFARTHLGTTGAAAMFGVVLSAAAVLSVRRSAAGKGWDGGKLFQVVTVIAWTLILGIQFGFRNGSEWALLREASGRLFLPLALVGVAATAVFAPRSPTRDLLLGLTLGSAAVFFLAPSATPVDLWLLRRAAPVLLPGLCLAIVCALAKTAGHLCSRLRSFATAALLLVLFSEQLTNGQRVVSSRYYAGGRLHFHMLTASLGKDPILLFSGKLAPLSFPPLLWAATGGPAYYISNPQDWILPELVSSLASTGRTIYLFLPSYLPPPVPPDRTGHWVPYLRYAFTLASPFQGDALLRPQALQEIDLSIYRWAP